MTAVYRHGSLDLLAYPYGVTSRPQAGGPSRTLSGGDFGDAPGGRVTRTRDGMRVIPLEGDCEGTSAADCEANRDALKLQFYRGGQRLVAGHQDERFWTVHLQGFDAKPIEPGAFTEHWTAQFLAELPYQQAATPTGFSRTPTLALLPGETTKYAERTAIAFGGTTRTPIRFLLCNQASGPTPTRLLVSNRTTRQALTLANTAGGGLNVPALSVVLFDPLTSMALVADCTNVTGYWPLWMPSGNALDLSGHSRDLTAHGAVTYLQDSEGQPAVQFDGSTGYFDSNSAAFGLTGNVTVLVRVVCDVAGTDMGIMGKAENIKGYMLRRTSANVFQAGIGNGTTTRLATGTRTVEVGQEYLLGLSHNFTSGTLSLFVNGELEDRTTGVSFTPSAAANNLRLGSAHNVAGGALEWLTGRIIGDPAVIAAELTAAQHLQVFEDGYVPAWNGVPALWGGQFPDFDPGLGLASNTLEIRADHGTTLPTLRAAAWARARYL